MNYMQPCPNPFLLINNTADGKSSWAECTEGLNLRTAPSLLARNKLCPLRKSHTPDRKARLQAGRPCPHQAGISGAQVPTRASSSVPPERARPLRTAHLRNRGDRKFAGAAAGCRRPAGPGTSCPPSPPRARHSWPRGPASPQPSAAASLRILPQA